MDSTNGIWSNVNVNGNINNGGVMYDHQQHHHNHHNHHSHHSHDGMRGLSSTPTTSLRQSQRGTISPSTDEWSPATSPLRPQLTSRHHHHHHHHHHAVSSSPMPSSSPTSIFGDRLSNISYLGDSPVRPSLLTSHNGSPIRHVLTGMSGTPLVNSSMSSLSSSSSMRYSYDESSLAMTPISPQRPVHSTSGGDAVTNGRSSIVSVGVLIDAPHSPLPSGFARDRILATPHTPPRSPMPLYQTPDMLASRAAVGHRRPLSLLDPTPNRLNTTPKRSNSGGLLINNSKHNNRYIASSADLSSTFTVPTIGLVSLDHVHDGDEPSSQILSQKTVPLITTVVVKNHAIGRSFSITGGQFIRTTSNIGNNNQNDGVNIARKPDPVLIDTPSTLTKTNDVMSSTSPISNVPLKMEGGNTSPKGSNGGITAITSSMNINGKRRHDEKSQSWSLKTMPRRKLRADNNSPTALPPSSSSPSSISTSSIPIALPIAPQPSTAVPLYLITELDSLIVQLQLVGTGMKVASEDLYKKTRSHAEIVMLAPRAVMATCIYHACRNEHARDIVEIATLMALPDDQVQAAINALYTCMGLHAPPLSFTDHYVGSSFICPFRILFLSLHPSSNGYE
jgi:hypothetical protein